MSNLMITKVTTIIFLLTFSLVYSIENYKEVELIKISELSEKDMNKYVKIKANVKKQSLRNGTLFLTLKDQDKYLKAVVFKTNTTFIVEKKYTFEEKDSKENNFGVKKCIVSSIIRSFRRIFDKIKFSNAA